MLVKALYTILIEPLIQLIEVIFMIFSRMLDDGMALVAVSLAISLLTYPFSMIAEKWQKVERGVEARLARKVRNIKSVFSGDERHLLITAYYRQNHYHPVYGLRNSIGLFIQIPFFMAAYICLSNLQVLQGKPFLFIKNLGAPDALIPFWGGVNLLPIVMTLVNCAAAAVYTKGLPKKDSGQLYLMAAVFLALLYDSPAGLVLYWTCNNLFSLVKNISQKAFVSRNAFVSQKRDPVQTSVGKEQKNLEGEKPHLLRCRPLTPAIVPDSVSTTPETPSSATPSAEAPTPQRPRHVCLAGFRTGFGTGAIIHIIVCAICLSAAFYLLFVFDKGYYVKRAALAVCFILVCFVPFFAALARKIEQKYIPASLYAAKTGPLFAASALILWALTGLAIPSGLIGSSVEEFSFIAPFTSPYPFVLKPALQAAGIFLLWPALVYALFSPKARCYGTLILATAGVIALIDTYLFAGNYGFLSITLTLSNDEFSEPSLIVLGELALLTLAVGACVFLFLRKRRWLFSVQIIALLSLCALSVFNIAKIQSGFTRYRSTVVEKGESPALDPLFTFSKTENNVLVVMMDRALSPFVPAIFAEKPELNESFSGFTWFPNCVSLGPVTISAVPPLFGGYEYAPTLMGKDNGVPLVEKHNQALLVMPRIFSEHGFRVTVSDPSWANYSYKSDISIYEPYPAVNAVKIIGKYTRHWLEKNRDVQVFEVADFLQYNLLRFSFLRIAPPFLRFFVYDGGKWLAKIGDTNRGFSLATLDEYTALDALPDITTVDEGAGSLAVITNQLTHEPAFLQVPEYRPAAAITDRGSGPYAHDAAYHANMAAFLLLARYFTWLKEHGAYDNTRIIITADHGWGSSHDFAGNITLPNGEALVNYNPLFLVKDFNAHGPLAVDRSFMTNADTPSLAVDGLIPDPRNPWTGNPLQPDKEHGVTITTSTLWSPDLHAKYAFKIPRDEYLTVHTDIFNPANWSSP
jgi:membrane protein insertase Oxa1/YidC/SpoIIIJ